MYNANKQVTTEAAIHSTVFGDLYIAIGDVNTSVKTHGQHESGSTPSLFGFDWCIVFSSGRNVINIQIYKG